MLDFSNSKLTSIRLLHALEIVGEVQNDPILNNWEYFIKYCYYHDWVHRPLCTL